MAIYTDEEIERFRKRWDDRLINNVVDILRGDEPANDDTDEIIKRIELANKLLIENGFLPIRKNVEVMVNFFEGITIPAINLQGVRLRHRDFSHIILLGAHLEGADLANAQLNGSNLNGAHLESATMNGVILTGASLLNAHLQNAKLFGANLQGANFHGVHLENTELSRVKMQAANLSHVLLNGATVKEVNLEGAEFRYTHLLGANFTNSIMGSLTRSTFANYRRMPNNEKNNLPKSGMRTTFICNDFLPRWRDHFKGTVQWKNLWNHNFHRWFYTSFLRVRIDDADTVMAADLYRYVKDQQFLYRFKERHSIIYWIWKLFSDCGGKLSIVFLWSSFFVGLFALLYGIIPSQPINPEPFFKYGENLSAFWKWIYVSFDIFSNLGIRATYPNNPLGVVLMIFESVLGFMMLGMLISVLANRFARRS